ncbi:MAG: hypothetical protein IJK92_08650 [Bacteroidales bacterium]|nr:hypothetical protein [Bacteroidales bacterium]
MKKFYLLIVCVALAFTQCKKKTEVIATAADAGETVEIALNVGGQRIDVNTSTGGVSFEEGDEVIVVNNGKYIGKLTYHQKQCLFIGNITGAVSDDYLHFYFLGNQNTDDLVVGESTGCSVTISNQIDDLPVISYGHSEYRFNSIYDYYSARLHNKCALAKFSATTSDKNTACVCIKGMNNQVTIDFSDASFSYDMVDDGVISLPSGAGYKYAILLPQEALPEGEPGSVFAGVFYGWRGAIPEIVEGDNLVMKGITIRLIAKNVMPPEGALSHPFYVDKSTVPVFFSKANLYYVKSKNEWGFLPHQYSIVEQPGDNVGANYSNNNVVTLFGWGTSGYNHGAVNYYPQSTNSTSSNYYAYGVGNKNLYDENGRANWGYYPIINGGKAYKQWRALTNDEWLYLLAYREDASEKKGMATINDCVKGIVLLPDDWVEPYSGCFVPNIVTDDGYKNNQYTLAQWELMEEAGAVFIPAAGYRIGNNVYSPEVNLCVWSSSKKDDNNAYFIEVNAVKPGMKEWSLKSDGMSVRLVCGL